MAWAFVSTSVARNPNRPQFLIVTMRFSSPDETSLVYKVVDPSTGITVMDISAGQATYVEQNVSDVSVIPKLVADWLRQYNKIAIQVANPIPQATVAANVAGQLNALAPTLKAEITNDPAVLGYGTWASPTDDARILGVLTDATKRPYSTPHVYVAASLVVNCFDPTEFAALSQLQLARLSTLLSAGQVDLQSTAVRQIVGATFPAGGPTQTALVALWQANKPPTTQSRAQELGIPGVTLADVTFARTN